MRLHRIGPVVAVTMAATTLLSGCQKKASDQMAADTSGTSSMQMQGDTGGSPGILAAMVGTHTTTMGNTMKVNADGSFTVTEDDSVAVHGQMKASGDTVTITDDVCDGPGVFVVHMEASGPTFTTVSDSCQPRRADLAGDSTATSGGQ